jgi:hypothetical protein
MVSNTVVAEVVGSIALAIAVFYFRSSSGAVGSQPKPTQHKSTSTNKLGASKGKKSKGSKVTSPPTEEKAERRIPGGSDVFASQTETASQDDQVADIIASFNTAKSAKDKRKKLKKAKAENTSNSDTKKPSRVEGVRGSMVPIGVSSTENFDDTPWTTVERSRKTSQNPVAIDTSVTTKTATASTDSLPSGGLEPSPTKSENRRTLAEKLAPPVRKTVVDE